MSFSMHDFLMMGFRNAIGRMDDYKIVMNSVAWHEKGALTEDDLSEIQSLIVEKNTPTPEPELEPEPAP